MTRRVYCRETGDCGLAPVVGDFLQAVDVARPKIVQGAMAVAEFLADPGEARLDQNDAVGVVAFLGDDRLLFALAVRSATRRL